MTGIASVRLVLVQLFTGTLDPADRIGECHWCGRQVCRQAGILEEDICVRLCCMGCASGREIAPPDPRAGDGCVCTAPFRCGCGRSCLLCLGVLPA